jgi:predicted nucleic acid-binding protein
VIGYFDSSALVKLVVEEAGSAQAGALWNGADAVLSSRVAHAEVRAAMAAARRAGRLTASQLGDAKDAWATVWDALRVVEVSVDVGALAGELAEEHPAARRSTRPRPGDAAGHAVAPAASLPRRRDQPVLVRSDHRLQPVAQPQLGQDPGDVGLGPGLAELLPAAMAPRTTCSSRWCSPGGSSRLFPRSVTGCSGRSAGCCTASCGSLTSRSWRTQGRGPTDPGELAQAWSLPGIDSHFVDRPRSGRPTAAKLS